jgi:hypothetical protein
LVLAVQEETLGVLEVLTVLLRLLLALPLLVVAVVHLVARLVLLVVLVVALVRVTQLLLAERQVKVLRVELALPRLLAHQPLLAVAVVVQVQRV